MSIKWDTQMASTCTANFQMLICHICCLKVAAVWWWSLVINCISHLCRSYFKEGASNELWSHLLQITGAAWKPLCTAGPGFASIHPSGPHPISFTLFCPRFLFVFSIQFVSSSPFYPSFFSQYKLFSQPSLTIIGLLTIKTNPPESLLWNSKPSQGHHQGLNMADQSNVLVFSSEKLPSEGTRRVAQN